MVNNGKGFSGFQKLSSLGSEFNAQSFLIYSILARISTATLVQIKAVTNTGGVAAVGTVDVLPLVNQIDGDGNAFPHGKIYKCPYFRMQGGTDAVILDPKVGDIGIAIFADRDISSVIANKSLANPQSNPGSRRRFDMADALYIGGVLNGTPQQYIQFTSGGITVKSPNAVTIAAPSVKLQNAGSALQNLLTAAFSTWAANHVHTDPQGGTTGAPTTAPPGNGQTSVVQGE